MTIALIIHVSLVIIAFLHISLFGSRPTKSLSWLLIVLLLPVVGIILYVVFGLNRRRFSFFKLKESKRRKLYDDQYDKPRASKFREDSDHKFKKLATVVEQSCGLAVYSNNDVRVLQDGQTAFSCLISEIEKAEKFIHLEYYILEEGKILSQLLALFKTKIEQGVEIRLLYDAIGSYSLSSNIKKQLKNMGVQFFPTMSLSYGSFMYTLNYRNHRKIVVIDGCVGFTGGMNISDKYISDNTDMGLWDDTHLCIKGPAVDSLHRIFIRDYYFASNKESLLNDTYLPEVSKEGDIDVQLVSGGPDSNHPTILQQYVTMINLAASCIYISNPYFIPNAALLEALRMAALNGVAIKILAPVKSDSWLAKHCMLSYFEELLSLGVEIFLQKDNFLHSKNIIVDNEVASVGSGNFDHRSFEHNFETNALIYDPKLSESIANDFLEDCKKSDALDYEAYKKRPWSRKLSEGIARFFSPLL